MPSMPLPARRDQDETTSEDVAVGVHTHKNTHTTAVITLLGVLLATATVPATAASYQDLVAWARGFDTLRRAHVEGTASYGAALTRYLRCEGGSK